ncbi:MAG: septum formation protein Maf [Spirochaetota bacterium]|nr:MAG: septum formation protein Maf [Spirochaetota bacterium]
MDPLVLASTSPRRREILERLGFPYIVYGVKIDEKVYTKRSVRSVVIELAKRKVAAVASHFSNGLIVGVDTVVCFQNRILGKPEDKEEARKFLKILSGNRHEVVSGITVKDAARDVGYSSVSITSVFFCQLNDEEVARYIDSGEWADKAGGYAIQETAALFVKGIVGSYYNVMGLPVEKLYELLKRFSYFNTHGNYKPVKQV